MDFFSNCLIDDLYIFESTMQKKATVSVSGRPFHSLSYRLSGQAAFSRQGENFLSVPDSVTFVKAHTDYQTEILEDGRFLVIHFYTRNDLPHAPNLCVFQLQNPRLIQHFFTAAHREFSAESPLTPACLGAFYEILSELPQAKVDEKNIIRNRMENIRNYIERHYADPLLSVPQLADLAGVSEVYLRRQFKAAYGKTPIEYIRLIRHMNARAMLKTGYFSVSETCAACGFSSLSYFSSEFTKLAGISPAKYARKQISSKFTQFQEFFDNTRII